MEQLKRCPFCGSDRVVALLADRDGVHEYLGEEIDRGVQPFIYCRECRSEWHTESAAGDEVIYAWNWRA